MKAIISSFIVLLMIPLCKIRSQETGQLPSDTLGSFYFQKAEEFYGESEYDSSTYYYIEAAKKFKASMKWKEYLTSRNYAGVNLRFLAKFEESFSILHEALSTGYEKFGEREQIVADIHNSLGSTYYEKMNYDSAFFHYNKSLQISRQLWGEENKNTARGYHNVGLIYYRTGDAEQALQHFSKALAIWLPLIGEKHSNIGNCYLNLANSYYLLDDYKTGLEYDLKALEVRKSVLGEEHEYVAESYTNLAITNEILGKYDEALQYDAKALSIKKTIFGKEHPETAFSLAHIAKVYSKKNEYEISRAYYDTAFTILNRMPEHPYRFEILIESAELHIAAGDFDKAFNEYDTALAHILPNGKIEDPNIASVDLASAKIELWEALLGKGNAYHRRYSTQSKNISDLRYAFQWYQSYAGVLEKIRSRYKREASKLVLSKNLFKANSALIRTSFELYTVTRDKRYHHLAFSFAERSKAGILQDAITQSNAKQFAGIPDSLLALESRLKTDLVYNETQYHIEKESGEDANETSLKNLQNRIFNLNQAYDNLILRFEKDYPEYYSLRYTPDSISATDVQKILPDSRTALLEYFVADSSITIFAITKNSFAVTSKKLPASFASEVRQFRRSIQNIESEEYVRLAEKLYDRLISPIQPSLKGIRKLYIIPDGILHYLPFEALLTKQSKAASDFSALPYLIKDFDISYQISARFILFPTSRWEQAQGEARLRSNGFLGIAPVFADEPVHSKELYVSARTSPPQGRDSVVTRSRIIGSERFSELKESGNEIKSIFNLFKFQRQPAKIFLHGEAKESILKSAEMGTYRFLHIATHGIINEEKPKLSGILFAAPDEKSSDDGILYSGEIYNLRLNADLVVLSACETGLGTIVKGEGMLGLARGFTYAGAKNLLVSLWQVADKSTAELMTQFYKNILNGQPYSTSLRNAKLALIKEGKYSHPVEWSPFVLTGK